MNDIASPAPGSLTARKDQKIRWFERLWNRRRDVLATPAVVLIYVSLALPWFTLRGAGSGPTGLGLGPSTVILIVLAIGAGASRAKNSQVGMVVFASLDFVFVGYLLVQVLVNAPATMSDPCLFPLIAGYCDYSPPIDGPGIGLFLRMIAASVLFIAGALSPLSGAQRPFERPAGGAAP